MAKNKAQTENGSLPLMVSWYLKYRPKNISELDQETVRNSLSEFVARGRIPHALLFAGPKGTGKTSAARIIAKILNCEKNEKALSEPPVVSVAEPCDKCSSCISIANGNSFSVIELDAASNRGIDDVRAIREAVKLSVPDKFRIYIIDEAHMLTLEAANALLKTLEEPPPHVVFILATTDPTRLPDTIRSRATSINFRRATIPEIVNALERVVKGEEIDVNKEVLLGIAKNSEGSFRDAIKLLEQFAGGDESALKEHLQTSPDPLISHLAKREMREGLAELARISGMGIAMRAYATSLLERLREIFLVKLGVAPGVDELAELEKVDEIKRLIELVTDASRFISVSPVPVLPLEMVVVEWCSEGDLEGLQSSYSLPNSAPSSSIGTGSRASAPPKRGLQPLEPASDRGNLRSTIASPSLDGTENKRNLRQPSASPSPLGKEVDEEIWKRILDGTKAKNHTIAALLRSAKPLGVADGVLEVLVFYKFHKERLEDGKNLAIVEEVAGNVLGGSLRISFILGERLKIENVTTEIEREETENPEEVGDSKPTEDDIEQKAEEIFGGKLEG